MYLGEKIYTYINNIYIYKHILLVNALYIKLTFTKPHILWQLLVCLPKMPRFSSGMLYLQNLPIFWKNKHSHPSACIPPFLSPAELSGATEQEKGAETEESK